MRLLSTCGYKWHKFSYALIGGLFGCGASILVNQSKDWGLPSITKITDEDLLEITLAEDVTKALKELQWYDGLPTDIIDTTTWGKNYEDLKNLPQTYYIYLLMDPQEWNSEAIAALDDSRRLSAFYKSIFYVGKGRGMRIESYKPNSRPTSKNAVNDNERDCIAHCRKLRSAEIGYYPFLAFSPSVFKRYLRCRSCDD